MARKYFRRARFIRLLLRIVVWNAHRFWPTLGWRTLLYLAQGIQLGLYDRRAVAVPLQDPTRMLARYEAWYGAFRPLRRHRADLLLPPRWWLRLSRAVRGSLVRGVRERVAIFGASRGGIKTYRGLRPEQRPVCFVDNDAGKQGQRLLGLPVLAPERLRDLAGYDRVIIGSLYSPEIIEQLCAFGVPDERIGVVDSAVLDGLSLSGVTATGLVVAPAATTPRRAAGVQP